MKNWANLRLECIRELGYAVIYINYLHKDLDFHSQKDRISKLCMELSRNSSVPSIEYWEHFLTIIQDEIENLV